MTRRKLLILAAMACLAMFTSRLTAQETADESLRLAAEAIDRTDYDTAVQIAKQVLAGDAENVQAIHLLATAYQGQRHFDKAAAQLDLLIEKQKSASLYDRRGAVRFLNGQMNESVADFDRAIELDAGRSADHWRRGIALYCADRFEPGAGQFASGQVTFVNDVENALWQFACVARDQGLETARKAMYPCGKDGRVPLKEMHALYMGTKTRADVEAAVVAGDPEPTELADRRMYALLYLALYHDLLGEVDAAKRDYAELVDKVPLPGNYMWEVGRVRYEQLKAGK